LWVLKELAIALLLNAKFRFFLWAKHVFFRKSQLRRSSLFASTQKVYRPRSQSPLHFVHVANSLTDDENKFLALGVCFLQPCSSAGRSFAASESRLHSTDDLIRFHNGEFDEMPCKLDSTENLCSSEKYLIPPPLEKKG